jgi:hypothetical protein
MSESVLGYRVLVTIALARAQRATVRRRVAVFIVAVVTAVWKLDIASTTYGTNDVAHWQNFAGLVRRLGPVRIYSTHLTPAFNHPPLASFMLVAINAITAHVSSVPFLIRVPATIADLVTALLVFELVRGTRSVNEATAAGMIVALSPVLVIISGFHGNTDPVFVMLALLSVFLLLRDRPALAGATAALACSVKLVPIVALPALAAYLVRDRRRLAKLVGAFAVVFVAIWLPAIAQQWQGLKRNVIDYAGWDNRDPHWGLVDIARRANLLRLVEFLPGTGRFIIVAIAALLPAALVWRRRDTLALGVGLALALFLLLTPAFATQYLTWAAAVVLLLNVWAGTAYNLAAGAFLFTVYDRWSDGFPWDRAYASSLTPAEARNGWIVWTALLTCIILGIIRMWRTPDEQTGAHEPNRSFAASTSGDSSTRSWPRSSRAPSSSGFAVPAPAGR